MFDILVDDINDETGTDIEREEFSTVREFLKFAPKLNQKITGE